MAKKLARNPTLKQTYNDSVAALVQKVYAEKVSGKPSAKRELEWYIPHNPVINPNKLTIKVIFVVLGVVFGHINDSLH